MTVIGLLPSLSFPEIVKPYPWRKLSIYSEENVGTRVKSRIGEYEIGKLF